MAASSIMSYGGLVDAATSAVNVVPRKGLNMTRVVVGAERFGNVLCDLNGVLDRGTEAIPGAGDALRRLDEAGFSIVFVTNNSTGTCADVAETIARLNGYPASPDQVITSAVAAAALLAPDRPASMVVGGEGILSALSEREISIVVDPSVAEAVVVGLDVDFTYQSLDMAASAIRKGARFIATNTDVTFPGPGDLHAGAGAIVAAIAAASGRTPTVAGKPHSAIRALVKQRLVPGPVWVVGDRPETDLAMAKAENWNAALVLTGVVSDPGEVPSGLEPDLVNASLSEFADVLTSDRLSGERRSDPGGPV
ncbi:putative hydrolase YutF [bacterium BMS3Abin02]|nr:putative hydrolase YutF [bacterium BMS3Abin02]